MGWWENFGWQEIWLTLAVWLLLKRYGRAGRKSRQSKRSSKRTVQKQTLRGLDHARTFHVTACPRCGAVDPVALTVTRLEWRPWRVEWDCSKCGRTVSAEVGKDALDALLSAEVAGGMRLSHREVFQARTVDWDVEAQQL
jgi:transcription elongation factor Elf1